MNQLAKSLSATVIMGASLMSNAVEMTTEEQLTTKYTSDIAQFWQTGTFANFKGIDDVTIEYAQFVSPNNDKCLLLVPGRTESYLKYQELSYDLTQLGFNLFIIDHRGQGISGRMQKDRHKGYVKSFDDYSDDLNTFVETIISPQCQGKKYLLAHSMGGAISARYLQRFDAPFDAALLASPMIAINGGGIPPWLAKAIINGGSWLNDAMSDDAWYFLGQQGYQDNVFADNVLMQSEIRHQIFADLYNNNENVQLGGVTFHWLKEALKANKDIFNDIEKLTVPTQVMQAGADTVIDNEAQNQFCQQLHQAQKQSCPGGQPFVVEGALHEIFFEQDQYRQQGLDQLAEWFAKF